MVIRDQQMAAFQEYARTAYHRELVARMKEFAPQLCRIIGDRGLDSVVGSGMKRAEKYGFTRRGPIRLFVELMFRFGSDFDSDPQLPWATRTLTASPHEHEMARADRLYGEMSAYLERVDGPNSEYAREALRRLKDALASPPPRFFGPFQEQALADLHTFYPQKYEYLSDGPLRIVIGSAVDAARTLGISTEPGVALLVGLKFGFGHGALKDPLYPWIGAALADESTPDPNDRAKRLCAKTMLYVDDMLLNV